ncbi:ABC transporter ATP-binding protein [Chelativorans sp. Marseille-P2723]|uniref:ABC transporter ATP-binding protein n=1 Tax=Chelativorans sp. Marseille-P2723 TaxID=2709133 RepID=UPI00156E355D|nr:ABC transporter ATP-binding protein [Chelativorans sp. Marseille-P2723]
MMLEIRNLTAAYGKVPALFGVDLDVRKGAVHGVMGHNGMGKTTLLRTVMGIMRSSGGSIVLGGMNVSGMEAHQRARRKLGYVPQGREIFGPLSVRENLELGCLAERNPEHRINEVLETFPRLKRLLDRRGGDLSGGEQQLLALARCLCARPELVLLDEPTEGIQPSIRDEIRDVLKSLADAGLTILLVEQNIDMLSSLCESVSLLERGRIVKTVHRQDRSPSVLATELIDLLSAL